MALRDAKLWSKLFQARIGRKHLSFLVDCNVLIIKVIPVLRDYVALGENRTRSLSSVDDRVLETLIGVSITSRTMARQSLTRWIQKVKTQLAVFELTALNEEINGAVFPI